MAATTAVDDDVDHAVGVGTGCGGDHLPGVLVVNAGETFTGEQTVAGAKLPCIAVGGSRADVILAGDIGKAVQRIIGNPRFKRGLGGEAHSCSLLLTL